MDHLLAAFIELLEYRIAAMLAQAQPGGQYMYMVGGVYVFTSDNSIHVLGLARKSLENCTQIAYSVQFRIIILQAIQETRHKSHENSLSACKNQVLNILKSRK